MAVPQRFRDPFAVQVRDPFAAAGRNPFAPSAPPQDYAQDVARDIENLATRLQSVGAYTPPPGATPTMLDRLLQVLNLPGAAVRGALLEANDPAGFNYWQSLWQNQQAASGAELLKRFGLEPENRFAAGAANFAAEVALDPLTYLGGGLLRGGLKAGVPFLTKEAPVFGQAFKGVRGMGELGLLQPRPETVSAALDVARKTPVLRSVVQAGEDVGRMVGAVTKLPKEFLAEASDLGKRIGAKTTRAGERIGRALRGLTETEGRLVIDLQEDPATRLLHGLPATRPELPESLTDDALANLRDVHAGARGEEKSKLQEQLRVATDNQRRVLDMQRRYDEAATALGIPDPSTAYRFGPTEAPYGPPVPFDADREVQRRNLSELRGILAARVTRTEAQLAGRAGPPKAGALDPGVRAQWERNIAANETELQRIQTRIDEIDAAKRAAEREMVERADLQPSDFVETAQERVVRELQERLDVIAASDVSEYQKQIAAAPLRHVLQLEMRKLAEENARLGRPRPRTPALSDSPSPAARAWAAIEPERETLLNQARAPRAALERARTELAQYADEFTSSERTAMQRALGADRANLAAIEARLQALPPPPRLWEPAAAAPPPPAPTIAPALLPPRIATAVNVLETELRNIGDAEVQRGILGKLQEHYFPHVKKEAALPQAGAYKPLTTYDPHAQEAAFKGTVGQMNEEWGQEFWWGQPGVPAMARLIRGIRATETYDFLRRVLQKPEWAMTATNLADEAKTLGVSVEDLLKQRGLTMWKPPVNARTGLGKALGDQEFAVSQDMAKYMDRVVNAYTEDESIHAFLKWFDKGTNVWKKLVTVYNPAFHVNNWIGNLWNMWLGGFSHPGVFIDAARLLAGQDVKVGKYGGEALRDLILDHGIASGGHVGSIAREGAGAVGYAKTLLSEGTTMERLGQTAGKLGGVVEDHSRVSLFLDGLAKGMAPEAAAKRVNEFLFDYSGAALSNFEQSIVRKIFPFWQWCVPEDCRILTRDGWKTHDRLRVGEEVFTYNVEQDRMEWQPVKEVATFPYDGMLMNMVNDDVHFPFTPDHRWPIDEAVTHERRIVRGYELRANHRFIQTAPFEQKESILTPREAAILGWVVTDGYHRWDGNSCEMLIYQSPKKRLAKIVELLGDEGVTRLPHPQTGVVAVALGRKLIDRLTRVFHSKDDMPGIVTRLSTEAALAMMEAMFDAEGTATNGRYQFQFIQKPGPVMEAFQILCATTGRAFNVNPVRTREVSQGFIKQHRHVKIHGKLGFEWYKGIVWCPVTPNGTWLMERDGKFVITGNTRFNVPLQIKELTKQPSKFLAFKRAEEGFQTAFPLTDEERQNQPEYLRQALPVGRLPSGTPLMFNPRLPLQDLNKLLPLAETQATGRDILASANPLLQLPIEVATNYNLFTRRPIEEYEGQTIPWRTPLGEARVDPVTNLVLTTAGGYPVRAGSAIMQAMSKDADAVDALRAARLLFPGLYTYTPSREQVGQLVEERQRLQDMIRKYRAELGTPVPTMEELRRSTTAR